MPLAVLRNQKTGIPICNRLKNLGVTEPPQELEHTRTNTVPEVGPLPVSIEAGTVSTPDQSFLVPGDKRLDSARLAEVLGEPVKLLGRREVKKRYGLTIGAISPLQIQDQTCFYADTALKAHEQLAMSSGAPDSGIVLARADLERLLTIRWLAIGETA